MIIKISLLLHQYHGNAWHHAHCEGLIDWPPAPWRILRSIVAGSYNANFSNEQRAILKQVLWKMAQVTPTYYLPPTAYLQWRSPRPQVMKDSSIAPGKILYSACLLLPESDSAIYCNYDIDCSDKELQCPPTHRDTFITPQSRAPIQSLSKERLRHSPSFQKDGDNAQPVPMSLEKTSELTTLQQSMNGITYLGRRESPAVWELVEEMPKANAFPDPRGVRVVASPVAYLTEDKLWDCLNLSAADVFQHRKQAVFPGVEQTTYKLESVPFYPESNRLRLLPKRVLLSVQGTIFVGVSQSIYLCEALHQSLVKSHPEPVFTGMDRGEKIGSHDHAFITPIANRTGRWIDYIELYSHQGFSQAAINAIANVNRVRLKQWVSLVFTDFSQSSEQHTCWESITPMFLSRYPVVRNGKPRLISGTPYQKDCAEHQALKYLQFLPHLELEGELSFEDFPTGLGMKINGELIAVCKCDVWVGAGKMLNGKHGKLSVEKGFKVWIEFTRPVIGPISLGYRCHYGFGSLAPVRGWVGVASLIPQEADASGGVGSSR